MPLHQNKRRRQMGLPEWLVLVLVGTAAVAATLWWRERADSPYAETKGRVLDCEISWTHYNAPEMHQKVALTYEYGVDGTTYTGTWTGFWPEGESPNALAPDKLDVLRTKGHPLVVLYDPENPSRTFLHETGRGLARIHGGVAIGLCGLALVYCAAIYPAWKRRT